VNPRAILSLLTVGATALSTGCYSYRPVAPELVPTGAEVRVNVTTAAASRLGEVTGRDRRVFTGEFLGVQGQQIQMLVPTTRIEEAMTVRTLYQRVDLRLDDILEIERRSLDRRRTALVAGTGAAVMTWAVLRAFSGGHAGGSVPVGPGVPEARLPGTSFP
jgi:hypothetical protein